MKHPALTRVMAVALAIMCAIMLIAGIYSLGRAEDQYADDQSAYEKLTGRIDTYKELSEKLSAGESYDTASEALAEKQAAHDEAASEYRTDLAERTATQGGYKQGAEALWEAKAELYTAKQQYNSGVAQLEEKEAQFNQLKASAPALKAQLGTLQQGVAALQAASAQLPSKPDEVVMPTDETDENYASDMQKYEEYQKNLAIYNAAMEAYNTKANAILSGANQLLAAMGQPTYSDIQSLAAAFGSINEAYIDTMIDSGEKAIAEAKQQLAAAKAKIDAGEKQIQSNLELIWYKMGQADEEEAQFAADRDELMSESETLEAEAAVVEERKNDEAKFNSTSALLKGYDGIKSRLDNGGALPDSADEYAGEYYAEYNKLHIGRLAICILEIVGGVLGFVCLPSAFEKNKNRILLLAPAVLCFVCAAAAEAVGVALGLGQSYAAIVCAVFALLYIPCAAPRNKIEV